MVKSDARGVVLLLLVLSSCGSSSGGGGSTGSACIPGASVACACNNGGEGAQACNANGSGFGTCSCASATGSAGTTGGAGASGAAGAGGAAGMVGVAGTTGTAGSAAGGSAGAGAGGRAGTGGAAGVAGGAGAAAAAGSTATTGTGGSGGALINCTGSNYNGRYVSVTFKDAIIGPGKVDHTAWDLGSLGDTFKIPNDVLDALGTALAGGDPLGGSLAVLAGPALNAAIDATAKPDAYGMVSGTAFGVMTDVFDLAQRSEAIQDNYTPVWPRNGFTFTNAPIDCDVRFDVTLADADLIDADDPIASVEINSNDLKQALSEQQKHYVRVDDQSAQQLLFVGVTVVQQPGPF